MTQNTSPEHNPVQYTDGSKGFIPDSPTWQERFDEACETPRKLDANGVNIGGLLSTGGRLYEPDVKSFLAQELQQARKEAIEGAVAEIENIKTDPKNAGWRDASEGLKTVIIFKLKSLLPQNESLT